ncbi:MAG: KUP/HAK/KT family potassium transporter, partial [Bdellovibrionales bacterium]|nr:KUP/HAK/KT family potassium transporter [Bdellovibrionales bacterium]
MNSKISNGHQKNEPEISQRVLTLAALGIVFGDIGTSPLYAVREAFNGPHGIPLSPENLLGLLSLILWSLILVISIKYLLFVMKADNKGEGGVLALTALAALPYSKSKSIWNRSILYLGLFGSSLLFGDGVITPAISVLSAVEGLKIVTPFFEPLVIVITIAILAGLFLAQHHGTEQIGKIFGPIIFVWYSVLGMLGIFGIFRYPIVLKAISPHFALQYFYLNGWNGILVLGAVFLVVTGGEALYADMGHLGRKPIQRAWFMVALPGLVLNYFGQGALLLTRPEAAENPFYLLAPSWALLPLVGIATLATVIASQALISGVFSLTRQAVQLGYAPRVRIIHTSSQEIGQIYIPQINWILFVLTCWCVLSFKSSSALA